MFGPPGFCSGKTIFVNNVSGNDSFAGDSQNAPFRTIAQAVRRVTPGDTIRLTHTGVMYKESLVLHDVRGKKDARIVVEGNGAVISGTEDVDLNEWEEISPGLFKNDGIYADRRFNMDVINRYFFLFDGKINRMNRCLKGKNVPFKKPEDLEENEWTFLENEKAFYIRLNTSEKATYIEMPVRSNGVAITGSTQYVTIKNLTCKNLYNDGFGITHSAREIRFYEIKSLYCGDDGISAHADCEFSVNGFLSEGNGTGICDTGNSKTSYDNVTIKDCVGFDLFFLNERSGGAEHVIVNSIIYTNANSGVVFSTERADGSINIRMQNVVVNNSSKSGRGFRTLGKTYVEMKDCVFRD